MGIQAFLSWVFSEAGAGWAAASIVLVIALVGWILDRRRRERAPRVIIQEIKRTKLLDIHPSQQDRLRVHYTDENGTQEPVKDLQQKEIVIYNNGTRDILEPLEPLELVFRFPSLDPDQAQLGGFWRWFFDDGVYASRRLEEVSIAGIPEELGLKVARGVTVELPYLNSYPVHRDYFKAYLVSDGEVEVSLVGRHSGKGWSAHFVSLDRWRGLQRRVNTAILWACAALLLLGLVVLGSAIAATLPILALVWAACWTVATLLLVSINLVTGTLSRKYLGARLPSDFE